MFLAFLLFGTPWFWLALVVPALLLIWFVENERAIGSVLTILITVGVFIGFGDKQLVPWVISHPLNIAEYILGYLAVGILWGIIKWFFHVLRSRDRYEKLRNAFLEKQDDFFKSVDRQAAHDLASNRSQRGTGLGSSASSLAAEDARKATLEATLKEINERPKLDGFDATRFKQYLRGNGESLGEFPPRAAHNKGRIIFWMAYWPFSAVWTLINDPITRIYRFLFKRLTAVFEGITNAMFAKYKDELAEASSK